MPSRINIGPENGPYVAINENNGDIELQDNTGAVVAKWDDGQSQWDFVENDISGVGAFDSESVNTEEIDTRILGDNIHFARAFDGDTPDERLTSALDAVESGDELRLEASEYTENHTIDTRIQLVGFLGSAVTTSIRGELTFTDLVAITDIGEFDGKIIIDEHRCRISNMYSNAGSEIVVQDDNVIIDRVFRTDVTFGSDTADGIIDTSVFVNVVDDGNNTIGDIA